jgi:hypothetical protein
MSTIEAKNDREHDRPSKTHHRHDWGEAPQTDLSKPAKSLPTPITKPAPSAEIPRKTRVVGLLKTLARRWPAVFGEGAVKPLKIGIDAEIKAGLAGTVSRRLVSDTLRWWVRRNSYLEALARPGARRHELDGSEAGAVSDHDREIATRQLEERRLGAPARGR